MTLDDIARIVDGHTVDGDVVISGPASIDSRDVAAGGLFVAMTGDHADGHDFAAQALANGAAAVLASRAIDGPHIVVDDVVHALGLLAAHVSTNLQQHGLTVIGITGSQGKTTTKDLLAAILTIAGPTVAPIASFNNELGVPITVLRADEDTQYLIIEMGARGIGHIHSLCEIARPTIGAVLNVGHAHAGEFSSIDVTAQAKGELLLSLPTCGCAVVNSEDPRVARMPSLAQRLTFGTGGDVFAENVVLNDQAQASFDLVIGKQAIEIALPLIGEHHVMNALAAAAVAHACDIDIAVIAQGLNSFRNQSPMRMEKIRRADGLTIINDAYNANPESMTAAIIALRDLATTGRKILVVGEMAELGDESEALHHDVGRFAVQCNINEVFVIGSKARGFAEGFGREAHFVNDVDEATALLSAFVRPDDIVMCKASRSVGLERVVKGLIGE